MWLVSRVRNEWPLEQSREKEEKSYTRKPKDAHMLSLQNQKFRSDMTEAFKIMGDLKGLDPDDMIRQATGDRKRGN